MCRQRSKAFRIILHLMSQLLWVVGVAVALSGAYLLMKYRHSSLLFCQNYTLPVLLVFAAAALLFLTGCLGSCLNQGDSSCLQGLFVYLLVVVFCVQSTASALAYFHSTKLDSEIAPLHGLFQNYSGSSQDPNSRTVDTTQEEFHCCGVRNYTDWLETPWSKQTGGLWVPHSCCNTTFRACNSTVAQPWQLYNEGCQVKVTKTFKSVLSFINWGTLLVFLVEAILFLTVAQLMREPLVKYHVLEKN